MQPSPTSQVAKALCGGAMALICISIPNVSFANKVQRYPVEVAHPSLLTGFELKERPSGKTILRVTGVGRVKNHVLKIDADFFGVDSKVHFVDLDDDGLREFSVCEGMITFSTCSFYRLGDQGKFVLIPVFGPAYYNRIASKKSYKKMKWTRSPGISAADSMTFTNTGIFSVRPLDVGEDMTPICACHKYAAGTLIEVASAYSLLYDNKWQVRTYSYSTITHSGPRGYRLRTEKVLTLDKFADSFCSDLPDKNSKPTATN